MIQLRPTQVHYLRNKEIATIAAGDFHSCFLAESGDLYGAGSSRLGQVGVYFYTLCFRANLRWWPKQ